jgi:hypothetical protein
MVRRMRYDVLALPALLLVMGCAETNIQAIRRLRPAYSVYRNELANVVVSLPPRGSIDRWSIPGTLYPPLVFFEDRQNDPTATAEIVFFGERNEDISLSIRSPVDFCLGWTGPKNPLSSEVWNDRGGLGEECEAALQRPWLVLLRVAESRLPTLLRMEAFLVYVPRWSVVGAFPITVYGRYKKEDLGQDAFVQDAQSRITSAFHQAAGCELIMNLKMLPHAAFHFDHRDCSGEFTSIAMPASLFRQVAGPAPWPNPVNDAESAEPESE